jgi:hypothetical protein
LPGDKIVTWTERRSGLKPPLLVSRALRWLWRDRKKRWNFLSWKIPALHREAERDTTGSFSRQPPVHTWIARRVQGSYGTGVAMRQHSALFAFRDLSER